MSNSFRLSAIYKYDLISVYNTASVLQDSFYADNYLASFNSTEESKTFVEQSKELLLSGKFDLRN